jgi:hypothetical protein
MNQKYKTETKPCAYCSKPFESRLPTATCPATKYCGRDCRNKAQVKPDRVIIRPTVERECEQCGRLFQSRTDSLKIGHGRHCSRECHFAWRRRDRVMVPCQWCGKEFETLPCKVADPIRGKFCGVECRRKYVGKCNERPLADRFWEKVQISEDPDACWIWTGGAAHGYGRIDDRPATHVAWEFAHGSIPKGMWVLHRCDNPICVNYRHLFLGDNADNTRDKVEKGRQLRGETSPLSILTDAKVIEMRRLFDDGLKTVREIAEQFEVHYNTVFKIVRRERWTHLT